MSVARRTQFYILFICCSVYILSFFHRMCPTVLASDLVASFGISSAQLGLVSALTMAAYGLMQIPSGILADTLGGKRTLSIFLAISGLCVIWFASSNSITHLFLSRFITGLGIAVTIPCMVILASYFPSHMYARASSLLLCSGGIGGFLSASPVAFASEVFGWRVPILFAGILTLAFAFLVFFTVKDMPKDKDTPEEKTSPTKILSSIVQVFKTKEFWPPTLWLVSVAGAYFLLAGLWWGPYLTAGNGLSKLEASYIISFASIVMLFGQPFVAYLSDAVFKNRKKFLMYCPILLIISCLMMLFFTGKMSLPVLYLHAFLFIIGGSPTPIAFTMLKETFPPYMLGTAIGCANVFYPIWAAILQNGYGFLLDWRLVENANNQALAFSDTAYVYLFHAVFALCMGILAKDTFGKN